MTHVFQAARPVVLIMNSGNIYSSEGEHTLCSMEKPKHGKVMDKLDDVTNTSLNTNKTETKFQEGNELIKDSCSVECSLTNKQFDDCTLSAKREIAISRIQAMSGDIDRLATNCYNKACVDELSAFTSFIEFEQQYEIDENTFVFKASKNPVQRQTHLTRWRHLFTKRLHFNQRLKPISLQSTVGQHQFKLLYKVPTRLLNFNLKKLCENGKQIIQQVALNRFWLIVEGGVSPNKENATALDFHDHSTSNEFSNIDCSHNGALVCDFCENSAVYFCENCSYYYCESSFTSLHPDIGPFRGHSVIPASFSYGKQPCAIHKQPAKVFCQICMKRRCVECVNTICMLHFSNSFVTKHHIDKEKSKLVADMEKLNKAMCSLNVYKDKTNEETTTTEILALYKKETIRQEFISFHELLIESEALLYERLDQEVSRRVSKVWMGQETVFTELQNDETSLTSLTVDLLQTDSQDTFIKGTAGVQDRYVDMHAKISDFHKTWARNSINNDSEMNGILSQPFSLFREKASFRGSIKQIADGESNICFHQKTLFVNNPSTPLIIENFVTETTLGPSTTIRYTLKLLQGTRHVLWGTNTESLKGLQLNTMDTYKFEAGQRYLLKLHPTVLCHMSDQRKQETEHPPSHMIIVVGQTLPDHVQSSRTHSETDSEKYYDTIETVNHTAMV